LLACVAPRAVGEEDPGIVIGSACAEIWATGSIGELQTLVDSLNVDYEASMNSAIDETFATKLDYDTAADDYRARYAATIMAILDIAGKLGNQEVYQKAWEQSQRPAMPQDAFDAFTDAVVDGRGTEILVHVGDLLLSDAAIDSALAEEHAAKEAVIAARREYLEANARLNAMETIIAAVEVCALDQRRYLEGAGPDPEA
jgi:hypothetical protein